MKKQLKISLLVVGLIIVALALAIIKNQPVKQILFYSNYCSHCKTVAQYITENNIKAKFSFEELEVADNKTNANVLISRVSKCGLDTTNITVPLFYDGQKCLVGDQEIINYLATKK